jgi:hypothetical protein
MEKEHSPALEEVAAGEVEVSRPEVTVTISHLEVILVTRPEALGYFAEGSAWEPGEEVIPEPADDEAVVFEEFLAAGLRMPPQPILTDILVKFQVQLHQLTPNAFAQFSMYFWVVLSLGGKINDDGFAMRY